MQLLPDTPTPDPRGSSRFPSSGPWAADAVYRAVFEACSEALLAFGPDGRVLDANPAAAALLGFTRDDLTGMAARALWADADERDRYLTALHGAGSVRGFEARLRSRDGRDLDCRLYGALADGGIGEVTFCIPAEGPAAAAPVRTSVHDPLTELPNRSLFLEHLRRLLERRRFRPDYHMAVLVLGLDDFAEVNELVGRAGGDAVLVETARRLASTVRPEDTVARLEDDRFAVLLGDVSSVGAVCGVADRIQFALGQSVRVEGRDLRPSASVGIALSSDGYSSPDEFFRSAEVALAEAKASGPAQYVIGRPNAA